MLNNCGYWQNQGLNSGPSNSKTTGSVHNAQLPPGIWKEITEEEQGSEAEGSRGQHLGFAHVGF